MAHTRTNYSPNILIYLEIGNTRIRLADVLYKSATLYDEAIVPQNTTASLVFSIDGKEEREEVILDHGITKGETLISFSYSDPNRMNGRHFPL
jgi:hypothetical protein